MNTRRSFIKSILTMGVATVVAPSIVLANIQPWESPEFIWHWQPRDYNRNTMLTLFLNDSAYGMDTHLPMDKAKKYASVLKKVLFEHAMRVEARRAG